MEVRPLDEDSRRWVEREQLRLFGGEFVVSKGVAHTPLLLPGFVVWRDRAHAGLATYHIIGDACELVTIDALVLWQGIGTALLQRVEEAAREAACTRLWLITTNDNTDALRFYQRRGYEFVAVHVGAVKHSRAIKPSIPLIGNHGIPIRDELELAKRLE